MSMHGCLATIALVAATLGAAAAAGDDPVISVRETGGDYFVSAHFSVPESATVVREVLTDYASIPRFMPDVRTSVVLERHPGRVRVEQEAVSAFLMFSKRVHLVLDVHEGPASIRFRDRSHRSFEHYEGAWTISTAGDRTALTYELAARPAFNVPAFVLRTLLNRNADLMIDRLRAEITVRAGAQPGR